MNNIERIVKLLTLRLPILILVQDKILETEIIKIIHQHPLLQPLYLKHVCYEFDFQESNCIAIHELLNILQIKTQKDLLLILKSVEHLTKSDIAQLSYILEKNERCYVIMTGLSYLDIEPFKRKHYIVRLILDNQEKLSFLHAQGITDTDAQELLNISGSSIDLAIRLYKENNLKSIREKTFLYLCQQKRLDPFFIQNNIMEMCYWLQIYAYDLYLISLGLPDIILNTSKKEILINFAYKNDYTLFLNLYQQIIYFKQKAFVGKNIIVNPHLMLKSLCFPIWSNKKSGIL